MRYGLVILILAFGVIFLIGCSGENSSPQDSSSSEPARHPAVPEAQGHEHGGVAHELGCATLGGIRLRIQRLGAIQDGATLGFNVIGDVTEKTTPLALRLESADGKPVSDTVQVSVKEGAAHAHIDHKAGSPLPARLVLESGETASLDLEGRAVDLHAGHHHGIVAQATGGEASIWMELKLHDDKGDLELWLYRDLKEKVPFDLPLDTSIQAEFSEMSLAVTLGVRNREKNEDEGGRPNVRAGKTNYFIFPGDSGQDPSRLQGRTFLSAVKITFSTGGVVWASAPFLLVPHAHAAGGHDHGHDAGHDHDHGHGKDHEKEHTHEHSDLTGQERPESGRTFRHLIVDTDMGLDDVRALFALLSADHLDIEGILTAAGSASLGRATDNLVGLLESNDCAHVPVVQGVHPEEKAAPPWRATANSLAGAGFPPPRHIRPRPETVATFLKRIGTEHPGEAHALVLGPLTSLAAAATEAPDVLARLHTLWIPVVLEGADRIRAWNLGWNPEAAETVLAHAPRIVLVDVGSAGKIRLDEVLAKVSGRTQALRWIRKVQDATSAAPEHRFVYDELAACAVANPKAVRISDSTYRLTGISPKGGVLTREDEGNVRVATFRDPARPTAWLTRQWQRRPVSPEAHDHDHALPEGLTLASYLRAFHGHLGPYVVLGYRMGRHALTLTHSEGHFNIRAHVHCGDRPPPSCMIDGIQLGAGCTLGKRNIMVSVSEGPAWVEFTVREGHRVTLRLRPEVPGRIKKLVDERGVEAAGRYFLEAPLDSWLEKMQ